MNYYIDIYEKFKCTATECLDTCCYGWRILVDESTEETYKKETSTLGKRLRWNVLKYGDHCIRKKMNGRCPYELADGLCELQKMGRTDCMPRVCREYPRRILDFGKYLEITLELACPEVARLVFENPRRMCFVEGETDRETLWTLANDDYDYLDGLKYCREVILDIIWLENIDFSAKMSTIYNYIDDLHHIFVQGTPKGIEKVEYKINSSKNKWLLYDFSTLDKIIVYNIATPKLKRFVPRLYDRINSYHRHFDKLTSEAATKLLEDTLDEMLSKQIVNCNKYQAYLSFTIQQIFMTAYEDYYLFKPVMLAFAYVQLLMIVDVCRYLDGEDMLLENQILEMGSLERRMRHNENTRDGMFERIRYEFMNPK